MAILKETIDLSNNILATIHLLPMPKKVNGSFDCRTISRRFGTWNQALEASRLSFANESNISDERLYENILNEFFKKNNGICRISITYVEFNY